MPMRSLTADQILLAGKAAFDPTSNTREAGTSPQISTSSQFFTYFYSQLTHVPFRSTMFPAGLIQVAARIRSSP